jgi:DMSO/TMAO reductase YedYZ molybdopterin-dependent catalytic subunit
MIIRSVQTILFLMVLLCSAAAFGQTGAATPSNAVLLTVSGEVANPLKMTAADLAKLPRRSV